MNRDDDLLQGLYETLVTPSLDARLAHTHLTPEIALVDDADQPDVLARHLAARLRTVLASANPADRAAIARDILAQLDELEEAPIPPVRHLRSLVATPGPGVISLDAHRRPLIPLSSSDLLTNARDEPAMGSQIDAELASADAVDLLCAFVMWHGVRNLTQGLEELRRRNVPLRVITTTYLGGTQRKALDWLVREFGAQVRIQYEALATRLHAKAWMFRRHSGLDTAYIGSSNLTSSALRQGIEWNVRLSRATEAALLDKFDATFETYWNDDAFQPYDPDTDAERLDEALAVASHRNKGDVPLVISGLDVRPYPHQQVVLDALQSERDTHDRHRNLVVAATGTGKTVMAALDYKRLAGQLGGLPNLLFVAHRKELLEQSLRTYREVLGNASFGELYVAEHKPERWTHVFASVQGLHAYGVDKLPREHFRIVVVDEFHHAEAATYRGLLDHLQPRELLGLTATPERADGIDVRSFFDGRIASELRLWDAIEQGLLAPFQYFGINDETDLAGLSWRAGRYDVGELSNLYTGHRARANLVLREVQQKVTDVSAMRAIGFCVSVAHAEYMARFFAAAGIPAAALSAETKSDERRRTLAELGAGTLKAVFAADLLNEGVDIPSVDTVLFLRPTESATIFLQQLGRGLRLSPGKDVLTVLDFVGNNRAEFPLEARFQAMAGVGRKDLPDAVEQGFPFLPSGCDIVLDKITQKRVIESIRRHLTARWDIMARELGRSGTEQLNVFLQQQGLELSQVVGGGRSWTQLRHKAGLREEPSAVEAALLKRVRALAHVDDPRRHEAYREILADPVGRPRDAYSDMLFFSLWPGGHKKGAEAAWRELAAADDVRGELSQVLDVAFEEARRLTPVGDPGLLGLPLTLHANYSREEFLAALEYASETRLPTSFQTGVLHGDFRGREYDALFVTVDKSSGYSPTTRYRDYPISRTLFHWESQSATRIASPTGQRYLNGTSTVLLFVRETREGDFGTAPYTFLGRARYVEHEGERPIAIVWKLDNPMPTELFTATAVAAS